MKNTIHTSRACVKVDLDAIKSNVLGAMKVAGQSTKMMVVIKTDAYGHGAVPVAKALNEIGVYAFAVATIDEAVLLRENGIENPILVLGYVFPEDVACAVNNNITLTVSDYSEAVQISEICADLGGKIANIHIKLDTGMGRIGFDVVENNSFEDSIKAISEVFALENIHVEGVFSHFAGADELDKTSAKAQYECFKKTVNMLESKGCTFEIKHISNSAGIMDLITSEDFSGVEFDMVRCGITTYGLMPSNEVNTSSIELKPAMSIVAHVSHIKKVEAGFKVSYGSTFVTERETVIATVPFGYGDGYPRSLSNKGYVLVGEKRAPIIGRVCMDQFMVDVTGIPGVSMGSEVVLVGKQGDEEITIAELSDLSGRFNYEFVCDINSRVPRIYEGGKNS